MIGSALLLGTLTIGEQSKIIKEIEKRTIYTIIAKPVHRYQFLLGRFAGLVFTMWVNTAVMLVAFCVILVVGGTSPDSGLMKAVGLMTVAQLIVLSAAMLFSTFTTPTLSGIFTLALYVIGELTPDLKTLSEKLSGVSRGLLSGSYYLLPNLALFNVKGEAVHGVPITAGYMLTAIGYGVSYAAVVLLLSCFVFQRRDF